MRLWSLVMGPLHLLLLALGLQQPGPRNLGPRPQLDTRLDTIADNGSHLEHRLGRQTTCSKRMAHIKTCKRSLKMFNKHREGDY